MKDQDNWENLVGTLTNMGYAAGSGNLVIYRKQKNLAQSIMDKVREEPLVGGSPYHLAMLAIETFDLYNSRDFVGDRVKLFVNGSKLVKQLSDVVAEEE